jgi:hypothetical protein
MNTLLSPEIVTVPSLTARCDRCGASARLELTLTSGGELAFCGHHGNRLAADITRIASRIVLEEGYEWVGRGSVAAAS